MRASGPLPSRRVEGKAPPKTHGPEKGRSRRARIRHAEVSRITSGSHFRPRIRGPLASSHSRGRLSRPSPASLDAPGHASGDPPRIRPARGPRPRLAVLGGFRRATGGGVGLHGTNTAVSVRRPRGRGRDRAAVDRERRKIGPWWPFLAPRQDLGRPDPAPERPESAREARIRPPEGSKSARGGELRAVDGVLVRPESAREARPRTRTGADHGSAMAPSGQPGSPRTVGGPLVCKKRRPRHRPK